ncbi:sulfite reductase [NADPH] flavoprotein alpha-component [Azorhizobium oxalatiphilum]|uniref:Sulfite reductase [NADPH] flavoprotein alpha-component n=1 Tax=Azorhizobium oxalatiphilum TaxID=980631 RepID=A0A917BM52_9HYPH|nr:sulfite reductase subunit alpha [Azorhizobium oxalatiphilum]GGF50061.1 sulfite reductase [NADPH] flavoprotein alpha-component [Azorhizobium oxalatiphilum]
MTLPAIPQDAPFSGEQRVWLAGFLAGLNSRIGTGLAATPAVAAAAQAVRVPLHVLYGTQTGNCEGLAQETAAAARAGGFEPQVLGLDDVTLETLRTIERAIIIVSTYGEGEMPDNAHLFWGALSSPDTPRLEGLSFAVLALGDTAYDDFCQAGKLIDTRLEQLGAHRVGPRIDCDVDYEKAATEWIGSTLPLVPKPAGAASAPAPVVAEAAAAAAPSRSGWSRKTPYPATLAVSRRLSGPRSGKDIRHYEFALADSGLAYEAGDALGVVPRNDPAVVAALITRLGVKPDTAAPGTDAPLATVLADTREIVTPSRELIAAIEARAGDDELTHVLRHRDREALDTWLWGRDVLDMLNLNPKLDFELSEVMGWLKPLQHRAYSISSSPEAHAGSVHLTVASVRWTYDGRPHGGVCSTYLADRLGEGDTAGIFVSPNKAFRPPADSATPMIMVGPGTGIAPFRAFLHHRRAAGASGRNWLFFGDQHQESDFIYSDELGALSTDGLLTRLDLAFSRDQAEKVYVQTRMRENGRDLFAWLQDGAHFYVCGDASRMAKDVEETLHEIIATHGGMSAEAAADYVANLRREKRYQRDVY